MRTHLLVAAALLHPATALPLVERAGGPVAKPIPRECTIINSLPHANCGTANVNGWMPDTEFIKKQLLYQAYFDNSDSLKQQAKMCTQQCYGYGHPGECKSACVGNQIPIPSGFMGSKGGQLETACLLFSEYLDPNMFVEAEKGQYLKVTAGNIYCPRRKSESPNV